MDFWARWEMRFAWVCAGDLGGKNWEGRNDFEQGDGDWDFTGGTKMKMEMGSSALMRRDRDRYEGGNGVHWRWGLEEIEVCRRWGSWDGWKRR